MSSVDVPTAQPASPPRENLARSAGIVSIAVAMSRVTGLLREKVMAQMFGASLANDAFIVAFRIPNLARDLFAEGALSSAFIPTFTEYLTKRTKEDAVALVNLVATALIIVVGLLCVLGMVFSPQLVALTASGFTRNPEKFALAVQMTRIMFPFLLLVALAAQAMGVLNACNKFAVPAMASTFFNLGSVAVGLALGRWLGPHIGLTPILGMAYGVVFGGALQLAWQLPSLRTVGFRFRPRIDWSHPGLRRITRLMGPAILGNAAVQINVLVNTNVASSLADPIRGLDGPASWLQFSFRFMQFPLGLFGVAIASATLPSISRSAAKGDLDEFRRTLSRSLGMVFLLTIPSSVGLIVLGESMIGAIYQGGNFKLYDTHQTGIALAYYAVGLAGYSALKVMNPAFYTLDDTRTPMLVSLFSVAINFTMVTSLIKVFGFGHAGLAMSTSVVALFGFVVLFWALRKRIGGIHGRSLLRSTLKILSASAVMGVVVYLSSHAIGRWLGLTARARLVDLAISVPLGMAVFYGAAKLARIDELEMVSQSLAGPLGRRFPFLQPRKKTTL